MEHKRFKCTCKKFKFCASAAIKKLLEPLIAQEIILSTHLVTKFSFTFTKAIVTFHNALKKLSGKSSDETCPLLHKISSIISDLVPF